MKIVQFIEILDKSADLLTMEGRTEAADALRKFAAALKEQGSSQVADVVEKLRKNAGPRR